MACPLKHAMRAATFTNDVLVPFCPPLLPHTMSNSRLRDLSTQDKLEHQRMVKDLEKHVTALQLLKDEKDKVDAELHEAQEIIDELQEQVDAALGAEEMVEKLTDKNLEQEELIQKMNENIADLVILLIRIQLYMHTVCIWVK